MKITLYGPDTHENQLYIMNPDCFAAEHRYKKECHKSDFFRLYNQMDKIR